MSENWTVLLLETGDSVEKSGCRDFHLHELFPRYAELWGRYIYPNRSEKDSSKLREGFPAELEDLFNNHYGVWYHLTIAYRQLIKLSDEAIDIGDPFFHLATAVDLIERTFVIALERKHELLSSSLSRKLTRRKMQERVSRFWVKEYTKSYKNWREKYKPVEISLHSLSALFNEQIRSDSGRKQFNRVANSIRRYRNVLAHSLPPLRIKDKVTGQILIPKLAFLSEYEGGHWSSVRAHTDPQHFEPAETIVRDLTDQLAQGANELWESLLEIMTFIVSSNAYLTWFEPWGAAMLGEIFHFGIPIEEDSADSCEFTPLETHSIADQDLSHGDFDWNAPGSAAWIPPEHLLRPPDKPSAYEYLPPNGKD
jgi:hypothetical protein